MNTCNTHLNNHRLSKASAQHVNIAKHTGVLHGERRLRTVVPTTRSVSSSASSTSPSTGLLLEVDGAVIDIHLDGHRVAFNNAFASIGMDCVCWSPPVYNDLLGCSDGTGEGLITAYYSTVGWPLMLSTSDRPAFTRRVHDLKEKELRKLLKNDGVPLRLDVKQVITDAVTSGAVVSLLAGSQCTAAEELAGSVVRQLGPDMSGRVRVFTFTLAPPPPGDAEEGGDEGPAPPSLSELLQTAAEESKQRAALQLVVSLQQSVAREEGGGGSLGLGLDPSLMAAGGSQQRLRPAYLSALVATTGVPARNTLAVASSNAVLEAAAGAGLSPVAVPRRFAVQGSFPAAKAKFEGYGPGLATWPRLRSLLPGGSS